MLVGRARALEIALGGDDFSADLAERYGWINRAIPDAELGGFVTNFVQRILSFDRDALRVTKAILCQTGVPSPDTLQSTQAAFSGFLRSPVAFEKMNKSRDRGLNHVGEFELELGRHIAKL